MGPVSGVLHVVRSDFISRNRFLSEPNAPSMIQFRENGSESQGLIPILSSSMVGQCQVAGQACATYAHSRAVGALDEK